MKKLIVFSLAILLFQGCSKDDAQDTAAGSTNNGGLSTVPATFTQKVLMEIFTGATQSQSTDGFAKLENILTSNSTKAIPVHVHFADGMEIAQYTSLTNSFSNGNPMTIPSGMVNRTASLSYTILNRTQWQSNFDVAKVKTAKCGLAIESSINGTDATITVHAGFNQVLSGSYTITTYIVEENVTGTGNMYDQRNAYNTTGGHPYNNVGDPIIGYKHQYTLRKVLSAPLGDAINSTALVQGGKEIRVYTTSTNGLKTGDTYVVAFITKTGTSATTYEVMNVQRVKLGSTQSWD